MITTIPELNEFLDAKTKRLESDQRDLDHVEGVLMNAQFDQLAAARKLEAETAAVVESVTADVVEAPQEPDELDQAWAEFACDQIDAGFFSGDTFQSREAVNRIEWYIARWQREIANIKQMGGY